MGIKTGSMVKDLEDYNMQSNMFNRSYEQYIDANYTLANAIYNFLSGKTDNMLSYEKIAEIINESESDIISIGCGLDIDKDFKITYTTPMDLEIEKTRIDVITPDSYKAYIYTVNINDQGIRKIIDVNKYPIFDLYRIRQLQKYLNNFDYDLLDSKTK